MATKPTAETGRVEIRVMFSAPIKDMPYSKREYEITATQSSRELAIEDIDAIESEVLSRINSLHGQEEFQALQDRLDKANRAIVAITKDQAIGTQAAAIIKTIK